jgi:hypothetical protein
VKTAGRPPQPIEKSAVGASLLAQVIVSKFADHRCTGVRAFQLQGSLQRFAGEPRDEERIVQGRLILLARPGWIGGLGSLVRRTESASVLPPGKPVHSGRIVRRYRRRASGPRQNEEMRVALNRQVRGCNFRVIPVILPGAAEGSQVL